MIDGPPQRGDDDYAKALERRRLLRRLAVAGPLALGLLVLLLACVLWIPRWLYPPLTETDLHGVSDAAKVQELKDARLRLENDARTTLLQGLGGVVLVLGAYFTWRQVQTSRAQLQQNADATRSQLKLSEQGQVTDRYTRAVEQLGHEKAPVRLGALYSLEHLAQDNPEYRQTVVDVFCAYLRMPYILPARNSPDVTLVQQAMSPAEDGIPAAHPVPGRNPMQEELQVRQTAQRLLVNHLLCPPQTSGQDAQLLSPSPQQNFWPGISLDLTGATLVDFTLTQTSVIAAVFAGATFHGVAAFAEAAFQDTADFAEATFQDTAPFGGTIFQGHAWFTWATFQGGASFDRATFQDTAYFDRTTFQGGAGFGGTTFQGQARFARVTFQGAAYFTRVTFQREAGFFEVTFQDTAVFVGATFQGDVGFYGAHVLHFDDDLGRRRRWPDGWTVRPDPTDPSRGTLVMR